MPRQKLKKPQSISCEKYLLSQTYLSHRACSYKEIPVLFLQDMHYLARENIMLPAET